MRLDKHLPVEGTTVLVVALSVAVGLAVGTTMNVGTQDSSEQDVLTWEGHITVQKNGEVVWEGHNVLTDQGQDWIQDQIAESTDTVVSDDGSNATFIAVGNGSAPVASTTQLDQEIGYANSIPSFDREDADTQTYYGGFGNFSMETQWTANEDIGVVNTTSLNWNSSGPSIVSGGAFGTEANILADDQLTVTHNITIS